MSCITGMTCHHSPTCQDLHCPGRPKAKNPVKIKRKIHVDAYYKEIAKGAAVILIFMALTATACILAYTGIIELWRML